HVAAAPQRSARRLLAEVLEYLAAPAAAVAPGEALDRAVGLPRAVLRRAQRRRVAGVRVDSLLGDEADQAAEVHARGQQQRPRLASVAAAAAGLLVVGLE